MVEYTILESINNALRDQLTNDPNVLIFGEDVGYGGVFRATKGLQADFGVKRVFDTPLAEGMIIGLANGMASQGLKPVCEIQFSGFIFPAMEQLICHTARSRNRTRSRVTMPITVRTPSFSLPSPEHHAEDITPFFASVPGIRVVCPSTPERAYRLLISSIQSSDPVIFCEPTRLYHLGRQEYELDGVGLDIGKAIVENNGHDVTVITWGAICKETRAAVQELIERNVAVELIDLVSVNPIDRETIVASVKKTGKCVIVHEGPQSCSVASEIAAMLADDCILHLKAPIKRVSGWDITPPYLTMMKNYVPSVERIKDTIFEVYMYDI